jgi:hypothetical protein
MRTGEKVAIALGIVFVGVAAIWFLSADLMGPHRSPAIVLKIEVMQFDQALNAYKEKFGEFPPDGGDPAAVTRHLARLFPQSKDAPPIAINPSTALAFWLGGVPEVDPNGQPTGRLCGFSANPLHPFENNKTEPRRIGPFYEFDLSRLPPGTYTYYPRNGLPAEPAHNQPYVYFAARDGSYSNLSKWGHCRPYVNTLTPNSYVNPTTFQILSPGLDGRFGTGRDYPSGSDYNADNYDDVTNFIKGATLQNDMPR